MGVLSFILIRLDVTIGEKKRTKVIEFVLVNQSNMKKVIGKIKTILQRKNTNKKDKKGVQWQIISSTFPTKIKLI